MKILKNLKKYRPQLLLTSLLMLILVAYNNCGQTTGNKKTTTSNTNTKNMLVSDELVTVGNAGSLLTYPGPLSPRIYFGDGRIVNNAHTAFPNLPSVPNYPITGWQLDQTPGRELMNPVYMTTNDPGYDSLLGKANWVFPTKSGDSHFKVYNNQQYGMVYEMFSKNGSVGPYGGTGLILGAKDLPIQKVTGKIKLDLDFRLSKVVSSNPNKHPSFHWFALSGMYFTVTNPETKIPRSFLIQIIHANHTPTNEKNNYKFDNGVDSPMLGGILNSDLDKVFYKQMDDFKHISLDINKYMCYATKQQYGSASGKVFTLPDYFKNPKNWVFGGYFFDLEHASKTCNDPKAVYGEACPAQHIKDYGAQLEVGVQVANINLTQQAAVDFTDICQGYPEFNEPVKPTATMTIDGVAGGSKTIEAGKSVALKYESTGAVSCTLTAHLNNKVWYQNVDFSTKHDWGVTPFNTPGNFKWDILCKNALGQTAASSISLNVTEPSKPAPVPPPAPAPTPTPTPTLAPVASFYLGNVLNGSTVIKSGDKIDLRYESRNATSCTLTAYLNGKQWYQNVNFTTSHNWGNIPFTGVNDSYKWEIQCKNALGILAVSSVSLKVVDPNAVSASFFIDSVANTTKDIKKGQSVNLRYESLNAQSCTLTGYQNGKVWYQNIDFSVTHNWGSTPFHSAGTYRWVIDCKNNKGQTASSSGQLNVK